MKLKGSLHIKGLKWAKVIIWNFPGFPAAHMSVASETPWIHFAKIDTESINMEKQESNSQMRKVKLSTNTMFSATFRMILQSIKETILACHMQVLKLCISSQSPK